MAMWFIAGVVVLATALGSGELTIWIYRASAAMLVAVGALTAVTGARTGVVWFKVCPALLTSTATVLVLASLLER